MTETRTIPLRALSIQSKKQTTYFGGLSKQPFASSGYSSLLHAAVPADIPANTQVISAMIQVRSVEPWSTATLRLRRKLTTMPTKPTWKNVSGTFSSTYNPTVTRSSSAANALWELDVLADWQAMVNRSIPANGWILNSTQTTRRHIHGMTTSRKPVLVFEYAIPGQEPTGFMPSGGAVSTRHPLITFTTPPRGVIGVQVQVDAAASDTSPDWDSGQVDAVSGVLDLGTTTYPGLPADGATTYSRARYLHSETGWSPWGDWEELRYKALPPVTIITPTPGAIGDGTPPVQWESPEQVAWRARLLDTASWKVLADSGEVPGSDLDWGPISGLTKSGQKGTVLLATRDAEIRVDGGPNAPTWSVATVDVTLTPSASVPPLDTLEVSPPSRLDPRVTLTGTRSSGIPDEVIVYRTSPDEPERQVGRIDGPDVFDGADFRWTDLAAPPNRSGVTTWRVAPVVNGDISADGPIVSRTVSATGVWLIDQETGEAVILLDAEDGTEAIEEVAIEHQPATGDVIRRRLYRPLPRGTHQGAVVDIDGRQSFKEACDRIDAWGARDAGSKFQLTRGHTSRTVLIDNLQWRDTPASSPELPYATATFGWRAVS